MSIAVSSPYSPELLVLSVIKQNSKFTLRAFVISLNSLRHPSAFRVGILGREAIGDVLLYRPPGPGTGKTLVCQALARECGVRMLQLKPGDIMNCYVGESEKLMLFSFS